MKLISIFVIHSYHSMMRRVTLLIVAILAANITLSAKAEQGDTIKIFFGGDLMQHTPQISSAKRDSTYCYKSYFSRLSPLWGRCDAVVLNLETTLTDRDFSGYPTFCSPWQLARDAKEYGVTHFVTANNHSCDKGGEGVRKTLEYLDSLDIKHTGTFYDSLHHRMHNPIYIKKKGYNIALINYTYGTNGLPLPKREVVSLIDTLQIEADIKKAQKGYATNIVALMHWGDEYSTKESKEQRELAQWLHDKGVDMVIGSHPHVVQPMEYHIERGDTLGVTVYSLGNFASNQRKRYTDGGIGVVVTLVRKGDDISYKMEYLPIWVDKYFEDDRWHYDLLPTLSPEKDAHKIFIDDTKKIVGDNFKIISDL